MTAQQQDERVTRAMREDFIWTAKGDGTFICETAGGKRYWIGEAACTCPDWQYRCSKSGARCKHMVACGHMILAQGASLVAKGLRMVKEEVSSEKGHCQSCGGWSHFRTGEPKLCYGCQMPQEKPPSAAEWLVNLDTSAIVAHVEEADAQDAETYRVVAALGNRERVVAKGLTKQEAEDRRWQCRSDPAFMRSGISYWTEAE